MSYDVAIDNNEDDGNDGAHTVSDEIIEAILDLGVAVEV